LEKDSIKKLVAKIYLLLAKKSFMQILQK
jgi:hypothetical protein